MKMIASLKDFLPIAYFPTPVQPRRRILSASVAALLAGAALALTPTDASAQQIFIIPQSNFVPPTVGQGSERCSTYFYYDGELGRKNYQSTAVTGGFRFTF